ncbi:MAG: RNA 2'-phosphotransferase [Myxococcota bacterium]
MQTRKSRTQLSKYLSFLLRHGGEDAGLHFDDQGFTDFAQVCLGAGL